jgi:hypothetical protein
MLNTAFTNDYILRTMNKLRDDNKMLIEALLDIRGELEDKPCSGPCDSYGMCNICTARSATHVVGMLSEGVFAVMPEAPPWAFGGCI